ncbi:MAG: tetratricopeptide repeat protein [Verrucomicrobiota bacterium]
MKPPIHSNAARPGWRDAVVLAGLILGLCLAYGRVTECGFVNFDDGPYVLENRAISGGLSWPGFAAAFTRPHAENWHPVTTLSHMLDCQVYGLEPRGHHLSNLVVHGLAAGLLYWALRRLTGSTWASGWIAGFFALHPLHVESVAWISERKDVLSGLFFAATLLAYANYAPARDSLQPGRARKWYAILLLVFGIGLLSKPMLVTTPFVLLFLDLWPLGRFQSGRVRALLLEKCPLLLMSLVVGAVTLWVQRGAIQSTGTIGVAARLANGAVSAVVYVYQVIWPRNLAVFYPYPPEGYSMVVVAAAVALLLLLTGLAWAGRGRWPQGWVGWAWYGVMLLPVLGLVQVGAQARADRYTYLPGIGLALAGAWIVQGWSMQAAWRRAAAGAAGVVLLACWCWMTRQQVAVWRDSEALWTHALAVAGPSPTAESNLANVYLRQSRWEAARAHFATALDLQPNYADARNGLGFVLLQTGQPGQAAAEFEKVLKQKPEFTPAWNNLGLARLQLGDAPGAASAFQRAVEIDPSLPEAHNNLGAALARLGRVAAAIREYREAIQLKPEYPDACNNLAWLLATTPDPALRDGPMAVLVAERASRLTGGSNMIVQRTLAAAYAESGRYPEALQTAAGALRLAQLENLPDWARAIQNEIGAYLAGRAWREEAPNSK